MTTEELKDFVNSNEMSIDWRGDQLFLWVSHFELLEFTDLIGSVLDEGGLECNLQRNGIVCIDLVPICNYHGVEPEEILSKL